MRKVSVFIGVAIVQVATAQTTFVEGFDVGPAGFNGSPGSITNWGNGGPTNMVFPSGTWVAWNHSAPLGPTAWFNNNSVFAPFAFTGMLNADANSGTTAGPVDNWIMSPVCKFGNTQTVSFFTRTITNRMFPARLTLRLSLNAGSVNRSDFSIVLLNINPALVPFGYPNVWTQFTVSLVGIPPTMPSGRIAFQYMGTNGGPGGPDFIGIDEVRLQ